MWLGAPGQNDRTIAMLPWVQEDCKVATLKKSFATEGTENPSFSALCALCDYHLLVWFFDFAILLALGG